MAMKVQRLAPTKATPFHSPQYRTVEEAAAAPKVSASANAQTIVLPFPPSYNRYWRNGHVSEQGLKFKRDAERELLNYQVQMLDGDVVVWLDFYRPQRTGDLDNRIKQVLDALQGKCYKNDSQIVKIYAARYEDKANPRVEIRVIKP